MNKTLGEYGVESLIKKGEIRDTGECANCGKMFHRENREEHGDRIHPSRKHKGMICDTCFALEDT